MPSTGVKPRQFRLTEETLALLDKISDYYQLASRTDAIRLAARMTFDLLPREGAKADVAEDGH